jgi:glycosyltransferase involved in cell wall biosynthesis
MVFGTLRSSPSDLVQAMRAFEVDSFSCDLKSRHEYPIAAARLARTLRRRRIDVVHTHLFEPSFVGMAAASLARSPLRVVTRHHSDYHTRIGKHWHVGLDRLATRLADAVIAVSQHTAEHLQSVEQAPSAKVHTIVNGIDFDRVRPPSSGDAGPLRARFAARGVALLVVPARLHPEKGHSYLFRGLKALEAAVSRPFVVVVAGDGPYRTEYEKEVQSLGCEALVRFAGYLDDLPAVMAVADLVVLPSVAEAFGLALAEALYLGTPVVSTRTGGIPEIVDHGADGLLVPPADTPSLVAALARLLNDEQARAGLAGAGREKIRQRFSFDRMRREYESLYDQLLVVPDGAHARSISRHSGL